MQKTDGPIRAFAWSRLLTKEWAKFNHQIDAYKNAVQKLPKGIIN